MKAILSFAVALFLLYLSGCDFLAENPASPNPYSPEALQEEPLTLSPASSGFYSVTTTADTTGKEGHD
jgi:hypothetical protein